MQSGFDCEVALRWIAPIAVVADYWPDRRHGKDEGSHRYGVCGLGRVACHVLHLLSEAILVKLCSESVQLGGEQRIAPFSAVAVRCGAYKTTSLRVQDGVQP